MADAGVTPRNLVERSMAVASYAAEQAYAIDPDFAHRPEAQFARYGHLAVAVNTARYVLRVRRRRLGDLTKLYRPIGLAIDSLIGQYVGAYVNARLRRAAERADRERRMAQSISKLPDIEVEEHRRKRRARKSRAAE